MTIFPRPSQWARSAADEPGRQAHVNRDQHYFAFLSYSHRDEAMAKWLHESLEKFRVPNSLVGRLTEHGPVPRRLSPIFRDLRELPASGDLGTEIREAIAGSRFLIVLCSPSAARSRWANAEIEAFKRVRPEGCILAAIVAGEPFASDLAGREDEECLPPALRYHYDRRGKRTGKRTEPLAADLREPGEARRLGFLKLVAGMLGLGLDDLVQRETLRRQRRLGIVAAASLAGMVLTSGLAVTAIQARDAARDERREAESLIGFMVGDLRGKLEPIGRLDVLDSVASRALAYYERQDTSDLSDDSLVQRSKALTLMGEIANARGQLDQALRFYSEAFAGTGEALRRSPDAPERMFDHAQNVYWIGYIAWQRGELDRAETAFREYDRLAKEMVAAEPSNTKWQLERTYASNNLGVLFLERARYRQASAMFGDALRVSEGLVAIAPGDLAFQDQLLEALAWLADAREFSGALDEALRLRQRQLELIDQLQGQRARDANLRRKAMTAHRVVGRLLASRGETDRALASLQTASVIAGEMVRIDAANTEWAQYAAHILLDRGDLQLASGQPDTAAGSTRAGCAIASRLSQRDGSVVEWRTVLPGRCLMLRARLSLSRGAPAEALSLAEQLVELTRAEADRKPSIDAGFALAEAELLRGEVVSALGDEAEARSAWEAAAAAWPQNTELKPHETAVRARLLKRLGLQRESQSLADRLAAIGYRHRVYWRA